MSPTRFAQRPSQQTPRPTPPTPRASSGGFLQRHPVLTYFVLVFTLSWGAMLLLTGGLGPIGTADPRFLFVAPTAPLAPAIVGLLLTGRVAGRAGYRDLLARLVRWRVSVLWNAVAYSGNIGGGLGYGLVILRSASGSKPKSSSVCRGWLSELARLVQPTPQSCTTSAWRLADGSPRLSTVSLCCRSCYPKRAWLRS
jgi:hypothetical protein